MNSKPRIAIIGAGLTGMRLAQRLGNAASVNVFEKSRGIGGRMSTRRAGDRRFDHGAQYFTARGDAFDRFLRPYIADGTVSRWDPRIATLGSDAPPTAAGEETARYVACPGMNGLCKAMGQGTQTALATRVAEIARREENSWSLVTTDGSDHRGFDLVLCTAPSVQTRQLMPAVFSGHEALSRTRMEACYSLMLGFDELPVPLPDWDAAFVRNSPLAWIAADHSKPGRSGAQMLCQSANQWATDNLERDQDEVRAELMSVFSDLTGIDAQRAGYSNLHRWRYAKVSEPAGTACLFDAEQGLGAAGDWCAGGRVESAFDSAEALAEAVLEEIDQARL